MSLGLKLIPRIALFSALIYVFSWGTAYLPNVSLIFFIVFTAGVMWGLIPGLLVGALGMGLWTGLNPYGPAAFPIMLAQIGGSSLSGAVGAAFRRAQWHMKTGRALTFALVLSALICTLLFYLPVNFVDAWLFQPFWPRFAAGLLWALISVVSNIVIFAVLFRPIRSRFIMRGMV
ncbi:MAG: hypothetical protein JSW34_13630 [Candidatus Zixiibacteriota bacterium]|nr:MAG: hypothetical protein JSW34_13630 [candidate division Zixibacteria bacterium]